MPPLSGPTPFGKYLLLDLINEGGMAEVFRAVSYGVEGFQRIIAIKRILSHWASDPTFVNMFIDEARIAVQINDPNVVQIFELGMVEQQYYMAMEYIAGLDLRHLLADLRKRNMKLPTPHAAFIICCICSALDRAHRMCGAGGTSLGIVHRDVTPHNVLLGYDGAVKVTDFGIAKAEHRASKTEAGVLKGKFSYMSPEQVRGLELDRRSDIFAIGILLYEILTGARLFEGESDFQVLERVRTADIPPPRVANPEIPGPLSQIVLKALAGDREQRYQWASELYDDLQPYLIEERSIFSTQKLAAFMQEIYAEQAGTEQARMQDLLRQAQELGPMVGRAGPAMPVEAETVISKRGQRPKTVILAVGSGEVPKLPAAQPAAVSGASQAPPRAGAWDDIGSRMSRTLTMAKQDEQSERHVLAGPIAATVGQTPGTSSASEGTPAQTAKVATLALLALLVLGVVVWQYVQPGPDSPPTPTPATPVRSRATATATPVPTPASTPEPVVTPGTPVTTVTPAAAQPPIEPPDDTAMPDIQEPAPATATPRQMKAELATARKTIEVQMKKNGIVPGDVPGLDALRAKLTGLVKHNKPSEALEVAEKALAMVRGVEIDQRFINGKLARFNKLSDANKDGKLKLELERLGTDTATAMSVGDFKAANQHLNKAFRLLRAAD